MRLLLDESIPVRLRDHLPRHYVATVSDMKWGGAKNGRLLALAARQFDALITVDKNIRHQQNLLNLPISVVVLRARSNNIRALLPLVSKLEAALTGLAPRSFVIVTE
jgi:predicted nuclease of predicted toxin-antitoxin system